MSLDRLKEISLFEGKTLDEIFNVIYAQSIEERAEAMATFKKFREMITDGEDLFMSGDKPHPYLDSAHKATENLIKMITASQTDFFRTQTAFTTTSTSACGANWPGDRTCRRAMSPSNMPATTSAPTWPKPACVASASAVHWRRLIATRSRTARCRARRCDSTSPAPAI